MGGGGVDHAHVESSVCNTGTPFGKRDTYNLILKAQGCQTREMKESWWDYKRKKGKNLEIQQYPVFPWLFPFGSKIFFLILLFLSFYRQLPIRARNGQFLSPWPDEINDHDDYEEWTMI